VCEHHQNGVEWWIFECIITKIAEQHQRNRKKKRDLNSIIWIFKQIISMIIGECACLEWLKGYFRFKF
jgi:hypothetical protein